MNILFLSRYKWPHVGGVEKHVGEVSSSLSSRGNKLTTISEKEIKYPHIKILGLFYIWSWLFKSRDLIKRSDIVHCHDVFIWYLPFRFFYPNKPVYTTFHGWEGIFPIPIKNILLKRLAAKLSRGNICVGHYIEKYYGIKANLITYGGAKKINNKRVKKEKDLITFIGRLEKDTGVNEFMKWLNKNKKYTVNFVGDGSLGKECEKYGKVLGFIDPAPLLIKSEICVPGGYLGYIEAKSYGCKIMTFYNNQLKKDYWNEIKKVKRISTWKEVADKYLQLWKGES